MHRTVPSYAHHQFLCSNSIFSLSLSLGKGFFSLVQQEMAELHSFESKIPGGLCLSQMAFAMARLARNSQILPLASAYSYNEKL